MPADLFGAVVARRRSPSRRLGAVPLSVALHAVLLVAIVVIPVIATTDQLPTPHVPGGLILDPTPVAIVPPPPPPPRSSRPVLVAPRSDVPLSAPTGIHEGPGVEIPRDNIQQLPPDGVVGGIPSDFDPRTLEPPPPPPPAPKVTGPVTPGGDIAVPRKVHHVAPVYPRFAIEAHVQGPVVIEAIISTTGTVQDARVIRSSNPLLDAAALDAVRQWVFTPTRLNGQPVPVILQVTVEFKLQ